MIASSFWWSFAKGRGVSKCHKHNYTGSGFWMGYRKSSETQDENLENRGEVGGQKTHFGEKIFWKDHPFSSLCKRFWRPLKKKSGRRIIDGAGVRPYITLECLPLPTITLGNSKPSDNRTIKKPSNLRLSRTSCVSHFWRSCTSHIGPRFPLNSACQLHSV